MVPLKYMQVFNDANSLNIGLLFGKITKYVKYFSRLFCILFFLALAHGLVAGNRQCKERAGQVTNPHRAKCQTPLGYPPQGKALVSMLFSFQDLWRSFRVIKLFFCLYYTLLAILFLSFSQLIIYLGNKKMKLCPTDHLDPHSKGSLYQLAIFKKCHSRVSGFSSPSLSSPTSRFFSPSLLLSSHSFLSTSFKKVCLLLLLLFFCVTVCYVCTDGPRGQKRALYPLELRAS